MGLTCTCQKIESEEETIMTILSSMNLAEIESKSVYNEFLRCINKDENYLDFFLFRNFLTKIVGENKYKDAQINFFENMRKMNENNIRRIGAMIIYLSKGSTYTKIELLTEHYQAYYKRFEDKTVKQFLNDMIESNTDNCLVSFREYLGNESFKMMTEIWRKSRKRKFCQNIYSNFESIKIKYLTDLKSPPLRISKLNNSIEIETSIASNNANNKDANRVITFLNGKKEDICEYYEKNNRSESEQFFSSGTLSVDSAKTSREDFKIVKEFIELSYTQLNGEYIRTWLYEDYSKEKCD